jgi:transposase
MVKVNAGTNHHNKLLLHYKLNKYAVNQTGIRAQIWIKRWAVCRTKAGCTAHWSIRQLPYRTLLVLIKPRSLTITDSPKHEPNYGKCQATGATLSRDHLGTTRRPHPSAHPRGKLQSLATPESGRRPWKLTGSTSWLVSQEIHGKKKKAYAATHTQRVKNQGLHEENLGGARGGSSGDRTGEFLGRRSICSERGRGGEMVE